MCGRTQLDHLSRLSLGDLIGLNIGHGRRAERRFSATDSIVKHYRVFTRRRDIGPLPTAETRIA